MGSPLPVVSFEISVQDLDTAPDDADGNQDIDSIQICDLCKRYLHDSVIFMYRNKAFCSSECRTGQIDINKRQEKLESMKGKELSVVKAGLIDETAVACLEKFGLRRNPNKENVKFLEEEGLDGLEFVIGASGSNTVRRRKFSSASRVRHAQTHSKRRGKRKLKRYSEDLLLHENNRQNVLRTPSSSTSSIQQNQNQSQLMSSDDHIISLFSDDCSIQDHVDQINDQRLSHEGEGSREMASGERVMLLTTLVLEALAATFDQLSSPSKPYYALVGVILSIVALAICVGEIVYKAIKAKVIWRRKNRICWLYHPSPRNVPFGSLAVCFGLTSAIVQCIFSTVEYAYFVRHANNPIKLSILPIIFATCLVLSRLIKNHDSNASSTRM